MAVVSLGVASAPFKCISRSPFFPSITSSDDLITRFPSFSFPRSDFLSKSCSQLPYSKKLFRLLQQDPQHQQQQFVASASFGREVYQPFRPPPNPGLQSSSIDEQFEILRERRGLWFHYSVHVASLMRAGFDPTMIEEATGISGVEQNTIVVATEVRSSLQTYGMDEDILAWFDVGGADLLYELRMLPGSQRKSAAEFVVHRRMDPKDCKDLAKAMKNYERRRREEGWDAFSFSPGDCLAFAFYRLSKEFKSATQREAALRKGLVYVDSEKARAKLSSCLEKGTVEDDDQKQYSRLQVVRLSFDEADIRAKSCVLPVVGPTVQEIQAAPYSSIRKGPFNIQHTETPWNSWIALPSWEPLINSAAPFAICCPNSSFLPWKPKSREDLEEPVLLVADKHFAELQADSYFIVAAESGMVGLQPGSVVAETNRKPLGRAVIVLRPPRPESDEVVLPEDFDD